MKWSIRSFFWSRMTFLLLLCSFVSCGRKLEDAEEVRAVREEVKPLREDVKLLREDVKLLQADVKSLQEHTIALRDDLKSLRTEVAQAVRVSSSPEFDQFLRVSRRMVSAMGTGVNYADFGQRLVDINAQAEETLPKITDPAQKANVADFVLTLQDAYILWRYKISAGYDRMFIETVSGQLAHPSEFPEELDDRWKMHFPELVRKYGLSEKQNFEVSAPIYEPVATSHTRAYLLFDPGLQHIFNYATKTFREIEKKGR